MAKRHIPLDSEIRALIKWEKRVWCEWGVLPQSAAEVVHRSMILASPTTIGDLTGKVIVDKDKPEDDPENIADVEPITILELEGLTGPFREKHYYPRAFESATVDAELPVGGLVPFGGPGEGKSTVLGLLVAEAGRRGFVVHLGEPDPWAVKPAPFQLARALANASATLSKKPNHVAKYRDPTWVPVLGLDSLKYFMVTSEGPTGKGGLSNEIYGLIDDLSTDAARLGMLLVMSLNPLTANEELMEQINVALTGYATTVLRARGITGSGMLRYEIASRASGMRNLSRQPRSGTVQLDPRSENADDVEVEVFTASGDKLRFGRSMPKFPAGAEVNPWDELLKNE